MFERIDPHKFMEAAGTMPPTLTIKMNPLQVGALMAVLWQDHREIFKPIFEQLRAMALEAKRRDGVTIEQLGGDLIGLTDCDGNRIVREPYPWELKEW